MAANILKGKELALQIRENIKSQTGLLNSKPCLAIILAGDNDASKIYVRNKIHVNYIMDRF